MYTIIRAIVLYTILYHLLLLLFPMFTTSLFPIFFFSFFCVTSFPTFYLLFFIRVLCLEVLELGLLREVLVPYIFVYTYVCIYIYIYKHTYLRGGEGTADRDAAASNCSIENCSSSYNKRVSSESSTK